MEVMNKGELQTLVNLEQTGNLRIRLFWMLLCGSNWNLASDGRRMHLAHVAKDSLLSAH